MNIQLIANTVDLEDNSPVVPPNFGLGFNTPTTQPNVTSDIADIHDTKKMKTKHDARNESNINASNETALIKLRIEGGGTEQKQVLSKINNMKSDLWNLGEGFSKYLHLRDKKDYVLCNLCISLKIYKDCEINIGTDHSTTGLKSHFKCHHYAIYVSYFKSVVDKESDSAATSKAANGIVKFFVPQAETEHIRLLCKLFVNHYFPLCLVESK